MTARRDPRLSQELATAAAMEGRLMAERRTVAPGTAPSTAPGVPSARMSGVVAESMRYLAASRRREAALTALRLARAHAASAHAPEPPPVRLRNLVKPVVRAALAPVRQPLRLGFAVVTALVQGGAMLSPASRLAELALGGARRPPDPTGSILSDLVEDRQSRRELMTFGEDVWAHLSAERAVHGEIRRVHDAEAVAAVSDRETDLAEVSLRTVRQQATLAP